MCAWGTSGIPHFVLDLLVDTLIRDRRAIAIDASEYQRSSHYLHGSSGCKTFWNMTLVHRTWTSVARRGLWYRVVLNGRDLETVKHDLGRCQRLRELVVRFNDDDSYDDADTQEGLLSSFLQQSTNIRTLYVDIPDEREKEAEHFLGQLSIQSKLERLWIIGPDLAYMGPICAAVSKMQNLKSLAFDCPSNFDSVIELPNGIGPPPGKLRSVGTSQPLHWLYVLWLLQQHRNDGVSDLAISFEDTWQLEENPGLVSQFYECLPRLKSLHVLFTTVSDIDDGFQTYLLNCLLSKATNLQCFTLCIDRVHVTHLLLPDSVVRLHVHKDLDIFHIGDPFYRKTFSTDDSSISSILAGLSSSSSSPRRLNALIISVLGENELTADELDELTTLFTKTRAICRDMQIALSFEARGSPLLGIIAEDPAFAD